jgi:NAD-dependent SIR2 family protein deacetylase
MLKNMTNVMVPICEDCGQRMYQGAFKRKGDKRVRWCAQCKSKHAGAVPGRVVRKSVRNTAAT